ncbi:MAG: hypothetical protein AUJ92_18390 [Armatimonadetes bacterium CG2_30_59_28]|nr:MAG: hypothetical protein AUJ92_18390 [Armatimonadetes bacterium CG2_30_59_28]PIU61145.1 MAG: hypothetical protein COS85_21705 [Armatimonadetes bacterium CG07_land_8_20_14_0_80_59_28]PIX43549.1 MAG: hypothetical protein COZ56_06900 [Armatimonadetes bacterium CG_4_8_14_3_um_filter_58_9]PJB63373.1 MAG: hypothetical protein CO095_16685 [Armatimonadetes bacterium CG_4_9_14_3_um_filter_58_7]
MTTHHPMSSDLSSVHSEPPVIPATAVVLAGGKSTRTPEDKALLPVEGKPMVRFVADRLQTAFEHVLVVTNSEETRRALRSTPTIVDEIPDQGPIGGLHTALCAATTEWVFLTGCDMPFVSANLARYLFSLRGEFDVVIPVNGELRETLHAFYSRRCLPHVESQIRRGKRRLVGFFGDVRVREVPASVCGDFDPELRMFHNVNTLADYARLQTELRSGRVRNDEALWSAVAEQSGDTALDEGRGTA